MTIKKRKGVKMKTSEQIIEDVKNNKEIKDYSLLEIHLYLCIKQVLMMFHNRQISKEEAHKTKILAIKKYNDSVKQYEFQTSMFQEHIEHIRKTEKARIKLRKTFNNQDELTREKLEECLNLAIEILSIVFEEEF